ncbi:MAG TPA: sugar phosphate isomerase/epimerase [Kiritimatiellia bacterium]|nr:sugar phosphate isomerase/epimerase [Kiritimatiellia bacterium]
MRYSRREFLQAGATGLVWAVAPRSAQAAARVAKQRKIQVGVQLYSVRELCKKDLPGTLKAIKEMGYAGVEFAGYYGKNAAEIKQLLDDNGLVMCGTHTGVDTIRPQNLAKTIEFNLVTGNRYLMVPGMNAKDAQGWIDFAKLFSDAAVTAKAAGMYVGYHNHQHEFKDKFDGKCKWEIFYTHASPLVCQQMDVGHVVSAGEDPVAWLKRFPNRSRTLHAKEIYPGPGILGQVPEGKQGVKWDEVFAAAEADVTEWYIVESEADPNTLEKIRGCIDFLKSKGRA